MMIKENDRVSHYFFHQKMADNPKEILKYVQIMMDQLNHLPLGLWAVRRVPSLTRTTDWSLPEGKRNVAVLECRLSVLEDENGEQGFKWLGLEKDDANE